MAVMVQRLSFKGMTQGLRSEDVYSEDNSIFVPVVALQLLFFFGLINIQVPHPAVFNPFLTITEDLNF